MKSRKMMALFMSAAVLAGTFAGCVSVSAETTEDDVVLTYWGWDSQFYKPLMDAYTELHPNVTFEVSEVASSDYVTKLQQTLASGSELPDILVSEMSYRGQQLSMDVWENLEDEAYGVTEDMFFEYTLSKMQNPDGNIVCIDENVCPSVFAYKRDLAKEYFGTDDPEELEAMFSSVEDVIEKAGEVYEKSNGEVHMFVSAGVVNGWICNVEPMSALNDAGELIFTEKFQKPIEYLCKLRDVGGIDIIQQWTPQDNAAYADSNHIFYPAANWSAEFSIKPNDPDGSGNWGMFTPPGGGYAWGGTAMGISKESEHKAEAWDFIKFCTMTQEGVELMKEAADYYTPVQSFYENPEFIINEDEYFGGQDVGSLLYGEVVPNMESPQVTVYDGVVDEVVQYVLQNIMADENYTAEQALEDGLAELANRLPDVTIK